MNIFERSGESDVGDDSLGTRRGDARGCPCGPRLGRSSRKKISERRHDDDDQRHGAHTVVEDASFACAADSGSQILCGGFRNGGSFGMHSIRGDVA